MASQWSERDFIGNAARLKAQQDSSTKISPGGEQPPKIVSLANRPASGATGDPEAARRYAEGALRKAADKIAFAAERNTTLYNEACGMKEFINAGVLDETTVRDALHAAARAADTNPGDPFTPTEVNATLESAFGRMDAKGAVRDLSGVHGSNGAALSLDANSVGAPVETAAEEEAVDLFAIAVSRRAYDLRVNEAARRVHAREQATVLGQRAPNGISLADFLAVPDEDAIYRIAELLPMGGRVLLAAQYKAGKTTLIANLLRSLVDGTPFLGRYDTQAVGRIALLDTELDERMLRRWLRTQSIRHTAAVEIFSLRGRLSTFDITDDETRAEWAARIGSADVVILDCLRPCLDALGLSEDKDAGRFLVAFDALIAEAHAGEATVVHHMGHTMERSRGDSRLLDWPDVLWKIVRENRGDSEEIDDTGDRFFSAMGRDVMVAESLLDYTAATGELMVAGGGRADKRARDTITDIVEILSDEPDADGLSQNQLVRKLKGLGNTRDGARRAVAMAVSDGVLVTLAGPRNTQLHILNPSRHQ